MELILKQDVANLGFKDDVVTVKNGYGRNYLIPHGYAVLATTSAKKVLAETLKQRAYKEQSHIPISAGLGAIEFEMHIPCCIFKIRMVYLTPKYCHRNRSKNRLDVVLIIGIQSEKYQGPHHNM